MSKINKNNTNKANRGAQGPKIKQHVKKNGETQHYIVPSSCALKYAATQAHPFEDIQSPCIPDFFPMPSQKHRCIARGDFAPGTNGVGFVAFNPWLLSNDAVSGYYSDASYTGTTIDPTAGVGKTAFTNSKNLYPGASFGTTLGGRLVGCGLRVRYIGKEVDRGGKLLVVREPNNDALTGSNMSSLLTNFSDVEPVPVTRQWTTVAYRPVDQDQITYWYTSGPSFHAYCMGAIVDGAVTGASFEWEVVTYYEFVGTVGGKTHSHSDPAAMGTIRNLLPPSSKAGPGVFKTIVNSLTEAMNGHLATKALGWVKDKAWSYAKSIVTGGIQSLIEGVGQSLPLMLL